MAQETNLANFANTLDINGRTALSGIRIGVTDTLGVANGGTGVTTSTGSGSNVLSTSPTLTTPTINTGTITGGTLTGSTVSELVEVGNAVSASGTSVTVDASASSLFIVTGLAGTSTLTVNNLSTNLTTTNTSQTLALICTGATSTAFINALSTPGGTTTTVWLNGTPTAGGTNTDLYQVTFLRTGTNTYRALISQSRYA